MNKENMLMEEFVDKYWDVIDVHSLQNALMVTAYRHSSHLAAYKELEEKGKLDDPLLTGFICNVRSQIVWRAKVEARIKRELANGTTGST